MAERRATGRSSPQHSALMSADGQPVTIVHLAAEYYPYARSGGLAEAVANLARFQSAAGMRSIAFLPLYRSARAAAGPLEPVGEPFPVRIGATEAEVRILRQSEHRNGSQLYFVEQDHFFDRERLYGDARGDYPDNHLRYACFALAALEALPRVVKGPVLLHAHDWHAALAPVYLRTRYAGDPKYRAIRSVLSVHNAGYQGHYPPSVMEELGLPWDLFTWRHLEWYGKVNMLKGGLVFADQVVTVSPNHVRELRTAAGGFGLQEVFEWLGPRFSGILNGIDQGVWDPATDTVIPRGFTIDDASGTPAIASDHPESGGVQRDLPEQVAIGAGRRVVGAERGAAIGVERAPREGVAAIVHRRHAGAAAARRAGLARWERGRQRDRVDVEIDARRAAVRTR